MPEKLLTKSMPGYIKRQRIIISVCTHTFLIVGAFIMLYPLLWMVMSSFKPETEIFSKASLWPSEFHPENYLIPFTTREMKFGQSLLNSTMLVFACVIGNLFSTSLTAYAFGRLDFKFKKFWFSLMLLTVMLPSHVTLIPQYVLFHRLGWINTFLPLAVPKFLGVEAFFVFLQVQFIRGIPRTLDDAAEIDGCSPAAIFRHIILPLLVPALISVAIFTTVWTWNEFFSQLIYLNSPSLRTVPLALRLLANSTGEGGSTTWGPMLAMATISILPIFLIFLVFQKHLVEGIATTGLKG
jgi:multiple sugar transport system permease protein